MCRVTKLGNLTKLHQNENSRSQMQIFGSGTGSHTDGFTIHNKAVVAAGRHTAAYKCHNRTTGTAADRDPTDLAPLPANLALILLHPDVSVHTLAADQLKVAVPPIGLLLLQCIHHSKVILWTPTRTGTY